MSNATTDLIARLRRQAETLIYKNDPLQIDWQRMAEAGLAAADALEAAQRLTPADRALLDLQRYFREHILDDRSEGIVALITRVYEAAVARAEAAEARATKAENRFASLLHQADVVPAELLAAAEAQVAAWDAEIVRLRGALRDIATGRLPEHPRFLATERAIREYARAALAAQPNLNPTHINGCEFGTDTGWRCVPGCPTTEWVRNNPGDSEQTAAQPTPPEPVDGIAVRDDGPDATLIQYPNPTKLWVGNQAQGGTHHFQRGWSYSSPCTVCGIYKEQHAEVRHEDAFR